MKHLAFISFLFLTFTATAQTAHFKAGNGRHPAGIHMQFNFSLTEVTSAEHLQEMVAKMKATPGVLKLDVLNPTTHTADLIIVAASQNDLASVQNAFAAAGIKQITYNEKTHRTSRLPKVLSATK